MKLNYEKFDTPCAIVDLTVMERNIQDMVSRLNDLGITHRPHIKAHKSVFIAKKQLELGAKGITVAKLTEAEAMIKGGITDILIANEIIGETKLNKLMELSAIADITTLIDSLVGAQGLNQTAEKYGQVAKVYIDVDLGAHRTGLSIDDAVELALAVEPMAHVKLTGVFGYASLAYGQPTEEDRFRVSKAETDVINQAKEALEKALGRPIGIVSSGASFSSRMPEAMVGITESRAGNYVFNDGTSLAAGVSTVEECALRVIATVISKPRPGQLILDVGSKGLSTDGNHYDKFYGYVVEYPEMVIYKLNEEHAYVRYPEYVEPKIGEKVSIIPNHGCVISNLHGELIGVIDGEPVQPIAVEARGALR